MRIRTGHSLYRHYAITAAAASLFSLVGGAGCASGGSAPASKPLRPPAQRAAAERVLVFENMGVEPVTLYLTEGHSRWLVGWVSPGRTAVLPMPAALSAPVGRVLSLVVVPASGRRSVRGGSTTALPSTITSEPLPAGHLTTMRWKLSGNLLLALPSAP